VNGRLTFKDDVLKPANRTLHSYIVYVRQGELLIGTEEQPYGGNATIVLYGDPEAETIAPSFLTKFGNKGLFIVGLAKMYGQHRDQVTRLRETVYRGNTTITVSPGLDWKPLDRIVLMATAMQMDHFDYRTIMSYDIDTGVIELNKPLQFYHWGRARSTADEYNGVDMRGEVVLLSRNVRVVGNDTDSWGGQILVSDNLEFSGVQRHGRMILDSVEVYNCSQRNTFMSAIRFENQALNSSSVTNSAVHGGWAWAFSAQQAQDLFIHNNAFIGAYAVGAAIIASHNITFTNNIIGHVGKRYWMSA
jgi:hypothetical protein